MAAHSTTVFSQLSGPSQGYSLFALVVRGRFGRKRGGSLQQGQETPPPTQDTWAARRSIVFAIVYIGIIIGVVSLGFLLHWQCALPEGRPPAMISTLRTAGNFVTQFTLWCKGRYALPMGWNWMLPCSSLQVNKASFSQIHESAIGFQDKILFRSTVVRNRAIQPHDSSSRDPVCPVPKPFEIGRDIFPVLFLDFDDNCRPIFADGAYPALKDLQFVSFNIDFKK